MALFRLISVAAAALLFAQLHEAGGDAPPANKSKSIDCLAKMNMEREAVGFAHFKPVTEPEKKVPTTSDTRDPQEAAAKVKAVCDAILEYDNPKAILYQPEEQAWTFGYAPEFGEDPDCSSAISFWKVAKLDFQETPPVYKSDAESPYDWYTTRSFIALFNPQPNPTVDCAFFECPYNLQEAKERYKDPNSKPAEDKGQETGRQSGEPQSAHALLNAECKGDKKCLLAKGTGVLKSVVCLTFPPPLVSGKAPFTDEQWNKISHHVGAGKMYSITAATSFLLAASALWVSAF